MYTPIQPQGQLDRELILLRDDVFRLSRLVATAIHDAFEALKDRRSEIAQQVINHDAEINAFRFRIEQNCYRLLATQQPTARDLRAIIAAIHIVGNLERIADHAVGESKLLLKLLREPVLKLPADLERMTQITQEMLDASLEAYMAWNAPLAEQIHSRDAEIDALHSKMHKLLIQQMLDREDLINAGTYLLWSSHNWERMADHVTNICERIVFMVTGELSYEKEG